MSDAPYDPYDPSKYKQVQSEIDKTVGLMRDNVKLAQNRDGELNNLRLEAENLNSATSEFRNSARDARKHFWKENMKMKMCLIAAVIILIIVIVVPIAVHFK